MTSAIITLCILLIQTHKDYMLRYSTSPLHICELRTLMPWLWAQAVYHSLFNVFLKLSLITV